MSSVMPTQAALLLRILRLRAGAEQQELARRLGVSQATISRWERAQLKPAQPQVEAWLEACAAGDAAGQALRGYFSAATGEDLARAAGRIQQVLLDLVRDGAAGYDTSVPYFADVAAGIGEAQEQRAQPRCYVQVPAELLQRDPGCYALRVVGDSMAPRLLEGDIVIVSPAAALHDGCIVAAYVEPDGDVVKQYRELGESVIELRPLNPAYPTLAISGGAGREGRIWGRVVLQQREL